MHDLDRIRVDAEDLVGDLRERGLVPLAVRVGADAQLEAAVGREARGRLLVPRHHRDAPTGVDRGAVRRLLAEDREADAEQPAVRLARPLTRAHRREVDRRNRAPQALRIVAAVEVLVRDVVERHLLAA